MDDSSRHEILRDNIQRRWESWGVEYSDVMDYLRHKLAEVCNLDEVPSEGEVLDCTDLLVDGLHPGHRTLEGIKSFQEDQKQKTT